MRGVRNHVKRNFRTVSCDYCLLGSAVTQSDMSLPVSGEPVASVICTLYPTNDMAGSSKIMGTIYQSSWHHITVTSVRTSYLLAV
jgi:hypothetical protein